MVGILSIPDEEAFGLDLTRVEKVYRLNNRNYEIVRKIHERNSIRGYSTVVQYPARLRSRKLKLVGGLSQLPEMMEYKLSYQTEERPSEGTLFSGFFGQFGIVDVVGYHICTSNESFDCTAHYFSNARFSGLGDDSADETRTPEIRHLHCLAMALEGLPLLDISDRETGIPMPAELLETIPHSMIGD
ncbi:hypothetical protein EDB92DRAFT_1813783 [Lactarius akahatsu]|uniref:Uncharacterized protein n=1 Tax=Lactarius akahatsu TaxID=416441 RepID=A0AAD4LMB3_9AGAM|nr:hypothetical protein EDB92DRAFT_1813783 [Lactarius akahatsu]